MEICKVYNKSGNEIPSYATEQSAGVDLRASLDNPVDIEPGGRATIPTGLFVELPRGFEAQVRPRSGLAAKHGITVLNSPGTIDADYRGEICVILANLSGTIYTVSDGDRIAQMVFARYERVSFLQVDGQGELSDTGRGAGGFGHTGK